MTHAVTYGITEERHEIENAVRYSYGIAVYTDAESDGSMTVLVSIRDITSDREKLSRLVCKCNRLQLSIVHLWDVIEDFLSD